MADIDPAINLEETRSDVADRDLAILIKRNEPRHG